MLNQREIDIICDTNSFSKLSHNQQLSIFNLVMQDWAQTNYQTALKNGVSKKDAQGYLKTPTLVYGTKQDVFSEYIRLHKTLGLNSPADDGWTGRYSFSLPNHIFLSNDNKEMGNLTTTLYHELTHFHIHKWFLGYIPRLITYTQSNIWELINEKNYSAFLYNSATNDYLVEEQIAVETSFNKMLNLVKNSSLDIQKKIGSIRLHLCSYYFKLSKYDTTFYHIKKQIYSKNPYFSKTFANNYKKNIFPIHYPERKQSDILKNLLLQKDVNIYDNIFTNFINNYLDEKSPKL